MGNFDNIMIDQTSEITVVEFKTIRIICGKYERNNLSDWLSSICSVGLGCQTAGLYSFKTNSFTSLCN